MTNTIVTYTYQKQNILKKSTVLHTSTGFLLHDPHHCNVHLPKTEQNKEKFSIAYINGDPSSGQTPL